MTRLMLLLARLFRRTHGDAARFGLLLHLGRILQPGMRHHWQQLDWIAHRRFNEYLARFNEQDGMNTHRHWMLAQALRLAESVPGDTAECGVFEGASSFLMCAWGIRAGRSHFAIDSFTGLSTPGPLDGDHWRRGHLSSPEEVARAHLAGFGNAVLLKGWIPEVFDHLPERRFAAVHIDVDLHEPTLASMRYFYERMSPGGVIVCDDYGFSTCPGATSAIDGFLADKPERMLALPCGGGLLIRGVTTSGTAAYDAEATA